MKQANQLRRSVIEIETLISTKRSENSNIELLLYTAEGEVFNIFTRRNRTICRRGLLSFIESLSCLFCELFDRLSDIKQDTIIEDLSSLILDLIERIKTSR